MASTWAEDFPEVGAPALQIAEGGASYRRILPAAVKRRGFEFRIFDSPFEMEEALRGKLLAGATARLVASFSRKWVTSGVRSPHDLPSDMQDFCISCSVGGKTRIWSRPWNVVPGGNDYSAFIQGTPGSQINEDPLAEVGCPYAVRGFDFEYIGLLWLGDLKWRKNRWQVFPKEVHETGITRTLQKARGEENPFGPLHQELLRKVQQAYRILLTRALKGAYVWFEDEETRKHIEASLGIKATGGKPIKYKSKR